MGYTGIMGGKASKPTGDRKLSADKTLMQEEKPFSEILLPEEKPLSEILIPEEKTLSEISLPEEKPLSEILQPEEKPLSEILIPEEKPLSEISPPLLLLTDIKTYYDSVLHITDGMHEVSSNLVSFTVSDLFEHTYLSVIQRHRTIFSVKVSEEAEKICVLLLKCVINSLVSKGVDEIYLGDITHPGLKRWIDGMSKAHPKIFQSTPWTPFAVIYTPNKKNRKGRFLAYSDGGNPFTEVDAYDNMIAAICPAKV